MEGRGRLGLALIVALISVIGYFASRSYNPVTQQTQHVNLTAAQEIALGLKAAPQMEAQFGGEADDPKGRQRVEAIGARLAARSPAHDTPYRFAYHLLKDPQTINAFALPGGQVFITEGLYRRLHTDGELAGVLGHETGHVVARHSAQHLAEAQLIQGIGGATVIAASDPQHPERSAQSQAVAAVVGQLLNLRFSRNDELQADELGVRFMGPAGYDPRSMIGVMKVLQEASSRTGRQPEFFSTHPNPEHRIQRIEEAIKQYYPNGVPPGLEK